MIRNALGRGWQCWRGGVGRCRGLRDGHRCREAQCRHAAPVRAASSERRDTQGSLRESFLLQRRRKGRLSRRTVCEYFDFGRVDSSCPGRFERSSRPEAGRRQGQVRLTATLDRRQRDFVVRLLVRSRQAFELFVARVARPAASRDGFAFLVRGRPRLGSGRPSDAQSLQCFADRVGLQRRRSPWSIEGFFRARLRRRRLHRKARPTLVHGRTLRRIGNDARSLRTLCTERGARSVRGRAHGRWLGKQGRIVVLGRTRADHVTVSSNQPQLRVAARHAVCSRSSRRNGSGHASRGRKRLAGRAEREARLPERRRRRRGSVVRQGRSGRRRGTARPV